MRKPRFFYRDSSSLLLPRVRSLTLETLVSRYLASGDSAGLESNGSDSYDFEDAEHIDLDSELPQNMNKIDAVLHFRNIRDSLRSPMVAAPQDPVSGDPVSSSPAVAPDPGAAAPSPAGEPS